MGTIGREVAEGVVIPETATSQSARRQVLNELVRSGTTAKLDELVQELLADANDFEVTAISSPSPKKSADVTMLAAEAVPDLFAGE